jgi:hypothetical protein
MITADGLTRIRKSADTDKFLVDFDEIRFVLDKNETVVLLLKERVVVFKQKHPVLLRGDELRLTGLFGHVVVDIRVET